MEESPKKVENVIVTGGCGFIGSHAICHFLRKTDWNIIVLDCLTYASMGFARLKENGAFHSPRVKIFTVDLSHPLDVGLIKEMGDIDRIIHFAAETHVDNSIADPVKCIRNNVMSTVYLLEYARTLPNLKIFYYFSTDEANGPLPEGHSPYKEDDRHKPGNPYAASKSASEDICLAYHNSYKVPILISKMINCFAETQHVEKFIPKVVKSLLNNEKIYIHCEPGCKVSGSRYYIHARNVADAILFIMKNGTIGEKYNISGEDRVRNLDLALEIASIMDKTLDYEMIDFHSERPSHDTHYGIDNSRLVQMGWIPPVGFHESLRKTVEWTVQHPEWLEE